MHNVNKIPGLLSKIRELQGFRRKKDPARFLLQGQFYIMVLLMGFAQNQNRFYLRGFLIAA